MPRPQIAVISDTHDHLPDALPPLLDRATEIWHLGDVCAPSTLNPLQPLGKPLFVVRGNCDASRSWPLTLVLEREGFRFQLQHLPPGVAPGPLDAILYGHLHKPQQENWQGVRILNPGAVTQPRGGSSRSFAWIRFPDSGGWTWEVETF